MTDPLQQLEDWAGPLLRQLDAKAQRDLARRIAQELRRSQAQRIAQQRNPDGSTFEPRKKSPARTSKARGRNGSIKAMFAKLRTATHLKLLHEAQGAAIGITGRAARIARVHQYGLHDRVQPGGPVVQYERREVLGFTETEIQLIGNLILSTATR
ncbi:phage virion morphogenesis protein [Hydrogenophaga sp.]|uniref:phage virion morphogenesis protein n=1 Tax=Hydrogenophaga sp. TaxID=1904254 RepID=UPI003F6F701E